MRPIVALALKDLRLLRRVRMACFFTVVWPVIVAVMFGFAFSGRREDPPQSTNAAAFNAPSERMVPNPARQIDVGGDPVLRERRGPRNSFEVTFPQGVLWGLIGCAISFGLSLVNERTRGTFVRLAMSPLSRAQIVASKALACFSGRLAM